MEVDFATGNFMEVNFAKGNLEKRSLICERLLEF
jgi:hypothetical protein